MKQFGSSAVLGITLALIVIYYLGDLNAGAVGLIVVLSVGIASMIVRLFSWMLARRTRS